MTHKKSETFASFSATHFKLWKKAEIINYFNALLQNYLESNWQNHCRVANIRDEVLVISAANGALATQLRFQTQTILAFFHKHQVTHLKKIDFIIDDSFWQKNTKPVEKLELSKQSKTIFESVAKNMKNERLKKAIEKFVRK